mmetsp:Transcript_14503/g.41317  ORF Transcript_14503/g.41317 Transcript_14503/m.41317 type:complete len:93 (+) Transcript_14503:453-731(+)
MGHGGEAGDGVRGGEDSARIMARLGAGDADAELDEGGGQEPTFQDYLGKDADGDCGRGKPFWSSVLTGLSFGRHRPLFAFCVPVGRRSPASG